MMAIVNYTCSVAMTFCMVLQDTVAEGLRLKLGSIASALLKSITLASLLRAHQHRRKPMSLFHA